MHPNLYKFTYICKQYLHSSFMCVSDNEFRETCNSEVKVTLVLKGDELFSREQRSLSSCPQSSRVCVCSLAPSIGTDDTFIVWNYHDYGLEKFGVSLRSAVGRDWDVDQQQTWYLGENRAGFSVYSLLTQCCMLAPEVQPFCQNSRESWSFEKYLEDSVDVIVYLLSTKKQYCDLIIRAHGTCNVSMHEDIMISRSWLDKFDLTYLNVVPGHSRVWFVVPLCVHGVDCYIIDLHL